MRQKNKPIVIAHRGASHLFPENTLLSIKNAITAGADMIELDVSLTSDGEAVVIHDSILNRTSNGNGCVSDYTLYELKKLDAGSWKGNRFSREKIPSLKEVLILCRGEIDINIEIKTESITESLESAIVDRVAELVQRFNMDNNVLISSFSPRVIRQLQEKARHLRTAILYDQIFWEGKLPSEIVSEIRCDEFNCRYEEFTDTWRSDIRRNGIPVNIYTVNETDAMKDLIKYQVKGIFTDMPDKLIRIREEMHNTGIPFPESA